MTNTQEQPQWRWHRPSEAHKSHLVKLAGFPIDLIEAACGWYYYDPERYPVPPDFNNDTTDPCRRCLRSAAGKVVGRG